MEAERARALRELARIRDQNVGAPGAKGGWLRASVFGVNDGLISNLSLVAGVSAAASDPHFIVLAGLAGLVAGAFSMGAGEYVSVRAQREVFESLIAQERWRLRNRSDEERHEVSVIYRAKGIPAADAERLADHIMTDPAIALDLMAREELGLDPDQLGSPWGAAIGSFISFAVGATLPVVPYFLFAPGPALLVALALCAVALFAVGALTAHLSRRPPLFGGVRMLFIGALAAGVTYLVGHLIGGGVAVG
jgi:VIT1/CCC1 family predicted Fe2+/Mn2+ transporter